MNTGLAIKATLVGMLITISGGLQAQQVQEAPRPAPGGPPQDQLVGPGGPGGPGGRGGPGGMMRQETKLLEKFDKNGDKRLDAAERKEAREFLQKEREAGRVGRSGFGRGRGNENQRPPEPGPKVSPGEVPTYPNAGLYDPKVLRTFFLTFDTPDWEKEMADFKNTDIEMTATLTVDGKTYRDVGVHFRGMSSFGAVGEGRKRSMNVAMDFVHNDQTLGGYRTLNLLNSHGDPTFLRAVLYYQIARDYIPAPKANFARVVINGESWGIYVNAQQFNREFTKEWFETTKGARWKVPGSPGGRGGLAYQGENVEDYKRLYEIKSKGDKKSWKDLIQLCKVLTETPIDRLEQELAPIFDIDGALKFLALENTLINNDGYWIRSSDYNIYQDPKGKFHLIPHDANETFLRPGGPGFGGPPINPAMVLSGVIMSEGDKNADQKLTADELKALGNAWFDKVDGPKAGKLELDQFSEKFGEILPQPQFGGPPGGGRGPGGPGGRGGPGGPMGGANRMIASGLFAATDSDKDGTLTREEFTGALAKWAADFDTDKAGSLDPDKLRVGLAGLMPQPNMMVLGRGPGGPGGGGGPRGPGDVTVPAQPPGGPGGPGGFGGRGGGRGGPAVQGVQLNPLINTDDPNKPLLSRLLAVPALRTRYLQYVRDIAERWLDWEKLGPIAEEYHALIAEEIKRDTRKLDETEGFLRGVTEDVQGGGFGGRGTIGLKQFAEQRRAFLLNHEEIKKLPPARR